VKKINVILSGGVGSRLWPLSRKHKPKQYLEIFDGQSLFQKTIFRNKELCDQVMVVGNKDNYLLSRKHLQDIQVQDFTEIIEACPRNTAAAIAFAALSCSPEDLLFVTPSDHLIGDDLIYQNSVERAFELAQEGFIVTFGLRPTHPETGFGYLEVRGEEVLSFREKPDMVTAQSFLDSGNFLWNSGMFCFQAGVFLSELQAFEPLLFEKAKKAMDAQLNGELDYDLSLQIPSISVDYAVMEKTQKIKAVPSDFAWSDMGSFESIYEYLKSQGHPTDSKGNMVIGTALHTEFLGIENTLLIHTADAILVLQKEHAQKVKDIYERLQGTALVD
jgi:mannose-1-phosphate guanylyltransferase